MAARSPVWETVVRGDARLAGKRVTCSAVLRRAWNAPATDAAPSAGARASGASSAGSILWVRRERREVACGDTRCEAIMSETVARTTRGFPRLVLRRVAAGARATAASAGTAGCRVTLGGGSASSAPGLILGIRCWFRIAGVRREVVRGKARTRAPVLAVRDFPYLSDHMARSGEVGVPFVGILHSLPRRAKIARPGRVERLGVRGSLRLIPLPS